ncbi:uncharacterized protein [Aegilops tauschii subsp. strangulata]|uniref:uncharacterized protein n=1 Tax=Aegilops tauschii subsp. strangulata TaxID=200361 RepID=UPI003CC87212
MSKTPAAAMRTPAGGASRSETPPRIRAPSQDRGRTRRRGDVVAQQSVQPAPAAGVLPTLTRTNYAEWALLMKVYLQAHGWWGAVSHGDVSYHHERNAMITILCSLPSDVLLAVGEKETAKEAWDAIATQRLGATRVREANAQKLRRDFEGITFRDGETIDDSIVAGIRALGDTVEESKVVAKFLRVVPPQFAQVAIAIETLLDISTLSLDEVTGRLRVVQDRLDDAHGGNSSQGGGCSSPGRSGRLANSNPELRGLPRAAATTAEEAEAVAAEAGAAAPMEGNPELLLAKVVELTRPVHSGAMVADRPDAPRATVFLNEEQSHITLAAEDVAVDAMWYLDTGASNHMTGDRTAFTDLDTAIT